MFNNHASLTTTSLLSGAGLAQPAQMLPGRVDMEDPALIVMTDFERISVVLVRPDDTIDRAHRRMIQRGVRLLVVVDVHRKVVGLITANDILGEKPMQFISARGGLHNDILVQDIMTPQHRLEALNLLDVKRARVGEIVATLQESGRQHALVVDIDANGWQRVRGLFSLTQIARQLGLSIQPNEVAHNFSEIEAQLTH